ncbi:MAG: ribonuclease HI [Candidatus Eisenbacteria bacterium]|nr:ribonuclease HI [Candidatus Eisenbacteria bacterium]MCC7140901.1 ribonuclease HI [Candidatus Eisenbacteria bacterium]
MAEETPNTPLDVIIYADGACSGNPGPGGWGAVLKDPRTGRTVEMSGGEPETTNNRMELRAVIEGLRRIKTPRARIHVVTDSRYIVDGMSKWIFGWQKNGWRTADKKPVKNYEYWQELLHWAKPHEITWEWVRGHSGHPENERCDALAVAASQQQRR